MTRKLKVLIDSLNHDGIRRDQGDVIEMEVAQIEQLLAIGAVEMVVKPTEPPKQPNTNDDPEQPQPAALGTEDANQNAVQEQSVVSASANSDAGSDAPKSGKKDGKTKAK